MKQIVLITQGSQAISLVRTLFALGYRPNQISVFTTNEEKNKCFINFLNYYKIFYSYDLSSAKWNNFLVISYSNVNKIKISNNSTFINFHPGILPEYKGSLSTVYSMINNEKYVGGTWHYMTDKIDSGNILYKFKVKIKKHDTAFSLNHKIFNRSIECLEQVINMVKAKDKGKIQSSKGKFYLSNFPKIDHLDKSLQEKINYFPPQFT
jgi:UDP-4-amino-4-deoxy-L-arabinose formyltransferase/UDP-glucuronic acid dehydrogenase (UDP-4-keto-hexauronic acid decarboxylating)